MKIPNWVTVSTATIIILLGVVGCSKTESGQNTPSTAHLSSVITPSQAQCDEIQEGLVGNPIQYVAEPNYPGFSVDEFSQLAQKLSLAGSSINPQSMVIWTNYKANAARDNEMGNFTHSIDAIAGVLEKPYTDRFAKHAAVSNRTFDEFGTPIVTNDLLITNKQKEFISIIVDQLPTDQRDIVGDNVPLGNLLVIFDETNGILTPKELAMLDKDSGQYKIYNLGEQKGIDLKEITRQKIAETANEQAIQKSGINPDKVVLWKTSNTGANTPGTDQARIHFNQVNYSTEQDLAEYMGNSTTQIPAKGKTEKVADYEKRLSQAKDDQMQKMCTRNAKRNEILASYLNGGGLGDPIVINVVYDTNKSQFLLQIASTTTDYRLLMAINADPTQAQKLKDVIPGMKPTVVYELNGEKLTAKTIQITDPETGNAYNVNINTPVNLKFNEASAKDWAAENDKQRAENDKQRAEVARQEAKEKEELPRNTNDSIEKLILLQKQLEQSPDRKCRSLANSEYEQLVRITKKYQLFVELETRGYPRNNNVYRGIIMESNNSIMFAHRVGCI